ncbi:MAG: SEC-C metal-binding domain-containing protein, partial [Pseudomonadota bacterium]
AKQHEREANIIADAGIPGTVTIATNMAGRGTDIVLGGNLEVHLKEIPEDQTDKREKLKADWKLQHEQVLKAGGLHIIGTERHESRRIDNQLRGRSGRQGDPGSTRFYLSMQDSLMRIFASEKVAGLMQKLGMDEGEAIEHPWVSRAIENAQRKVEAHNFDIRKQLLQYDDVANDQRKVIYQQRNDLLHSESISDAIQDMRKDVLQGTFRSYVPVGSLDEQWDVAGLDQSLSSDFGIDLNIKRLLDTEDEITDDEIYDHILEKFEASYREKGETLGEELLVRLEKEIALMILDRHWKEHLAAMDYLRQGIGLRGYAQKNPVQEYKRESFEMFTNMLDGINYEVIQALTRVQIRDEGQVAALEQSHQPDQEMRMEHASADNPLNADQEDPVDEQQPFVRKDKKIGRNEPCWCGSGKKFKQCHGKL